MASESMHDGGLKCGKCRSGVLVTETQYFGRDSDPTMWFLNSDDLPPWVSALIEQSGWTKGRLTCPNEECNSRVGAFDFIGRSSGSTHLIKSKVDEFGASSRDQSLTEVLERRMAAIATASTSLNRCSNGSVVEDPVAGSGDVHIESSGPEDGSGWATSSSSLEHDDENSVGTDVFNHLDVVVGERGDMQMVQHRKRRRRIQGSRKNCRSFSRKKQELRGNKTTKRMKSKDQLLLQDILNGEPELDAIDPSLICPVCLDLLHDPYSIVPCKHIFCETCLRRLGSKNVMNTLCPLCRQQITFCEPQADLAENIKHQYNRLYHKRKRFEHGSTNVYVYRLPLPWRPGWRNLISGRPLGGNRFNGQTTGELIGRIVHQLPYYLPPVVFANLLNLVFFVFLLFAAEVVPLILSFFLKRPLGEDLQYRRIAEALRSQFDVENVPAKSAGSALDDPVPDDASASPDSDTFTESVVESFSGEGMYPVAEDVALVLDTTFCYAFYFVVIVVSGLGNFILMYQNYQSPQRDGFWNRILVHPSLVRCSRAIVFASFIGFVCLPFLVLPFIDLSETLGTYGALKPIFNLLIQAVLGVSDIATSIYECSWLGSIVASLI